MDQERIGKFIAKLRKEKNLTQSELAEQLRVSTNAVSKWERGLSLMDISLLKPLSEILGVSVSDLLNGKKIDNVNDDIINDTITASANTYVKREKSKVIRSVLIMILSVIILIFAALTIISEINYGIVPLGSKAYIDMPNIYSSNIKKQADKCMNLIIDKDIAALDKLVISNNNYLLFEDSSSYTMIDERLKKLSKDTHSKTYIDNLKQFYKEVNVRKYKYNFFYYDGKGYVFDYSLEIKYNNKDYVLDIQILPYKEKVEFSSFGFKNNDVELFSDLYNLVYSVFYW